LLSLEALAKRAMRVHGVAFIGNPDEDVEGTIARVGKARRLGRLPTVEPLNAARLAEVFWANFDLRDFGAIHG
jgi:dethiobiotin synthetase